MKKIIFVLWLFSSCFWANFVYAQKYVRDLGRMTPFYRNQPILPGWSVSCFVEPPKFLLSSQISFPYKRRPFEKEILFTDEITLVRFLGGWSKKKDANAEQWDLAYRDIDGVIKYRWELIPQRMGMLLDMGYTNLTIVLDNTPWCFPDHPFEPQGKGYGQCAKPSDMDEWRCFVENLCKELVRLYGFEQVNSWRFRLGTEAAQQNRFAGTPEEYEEFYFVTAAAVKQILPDAKFGPYNRAAGGAPNALAKLARKCKERNLPFDFLAFSTYNIGKTDDGKVILADPDERAANRITPLWEQVTSALGDTIPCEIQEYGWFLVDELGNPNKELGARGAAGNFYYQMELRSHGLNKLFHWILRDGPFEEKYPLFGSQCWLYSIYDHLIGMQTYELVTETEKVPDKSQKIKSVAFVDDDCGYILACCYNVDRTIKISHRIRIYIPDEIFCHENLVVKMTALNDTTDTYRIFREDLKKVGLLKSPFVNNEELIGSVSQMGGKKGYDFLCANFDKYVDSMADNLTLKPYNGKILREGGGTILELDLNSPEVIVLSLKNKAKK